MNGGLQGVEAVLKRVYKLSTDIRHVEKPMKAAGVYMLGSIEKNFKAGGRPDKWQALAESTLARRKAGKGKGGVKILVDTAALKNSMAMKLTTAGVEVGTNKVQAKRMHFGYPGGTGRGHAKTPARPYMMFQDEDHDAIAQIMSRHLRG